MKILVTGSAGYIGSNLTLALRARAYDAVGVDSFNDYYSPRIKRHWALGIEAAGGMTTEADLSSDPLAGILQGVECVVHLAAQPGISAATPGESYFKNNILATHRLVEACKEAGVRRFINIATSSVYGLNADGNETVAPQPASWYGVTKLAAAQEVLASCRGGHLPACSLRLFSVYGERERPEKLVPLLIKSIVSDTPFPLYEGSRDHLRSFTYVGDICEGIIKVLENWDAAEGEIFNLGSDQVFSTGDAIEVIEEILGKKSRIAAMPPRPGDQKSTKANVDKIADTLGWRPSTGLREGIGRTVAWYLADIHEKVAWE